MQNLLGREGGSLLIRWEKPVWPPSAGHGSAQVLPPQYANLESRLSAAGQMEKFLKKKKSTQTTQQSIQHKQTKLPFEMPPPPPTSPLEKRLEGAERPQSECPVGVTFTLPGVCTHGTPIKAAQGQSCPHHDALTLLSFMGTLCQEQAAGTQTPNRDENEKRD